ncbi:MAG TPA: ribokinase [Oleiagrimonas sp.]|nr:ribokinase [Oleiagrimonas sp.]
MPAQVIVVGSYNQDHVWHIDRCPAAGETRRGHDFATGPGGKGFNQAVACARQDVATAFIGAHGDDALGRQAEAIAADEGLDGHWQIDRVHATGSACIIVEDGGQNRIVVDLGANEHLDTTHINAQHTVFADARVLLTQMENNLDAVTHALARGRENQLTCVLNPAPIHVDASPECLRLADVLTPNEGEFAELCTRFTGQSVDADNVADMNDASLHRLARQLTDASVIITLGAHGSFVSHGNNRRGDTQAHYRIAAQAVEAVDTTAAGDAFCGALAAALVRLANQPFGNAVTHANRVAAMATERRGAASVMPRWAEVRERFGD